MLSDPFATAGGRDAAGSNVVRDPMAVRAMLTPGNNFVNFDKAPR